MIKREDAEGSGRPVGQSPSLSMASSAKLEERQGSGEGDWKALVSHMDGVRHAFNAWKEFKPRIRDCAAEAPGPGVRDWNAPQKQGHGHARSLVEPLP
jgi:hypothetical protein